MSFFAAIICRSGSVLQTLRQSAPWEKSLVRVAQYYRSPVCGKRELTPSGLCYSLDSSLL